MPNILNTQTLEAMGARYAVLGVAGYALPVRFRVRGPLVECLVPTWNQLLCIKPRRMELFDEQRGWGFRETADF